MSRRCLRFLVAAAVGFSLASIRQLALAEGPYVLTYDAPPRCPTGDALRKYVAAHVHDPSRASGIRIDLRVVQSNNGFVGYLVAWDEAKTQRQRTVVGDDCADVAHALAFLAALAIDLGGYLEPEPAGPPSPSSSAEPPLNMPPPVADRPPTGSTAPPAGRSALPRPPVPRPSEGGQREPRPRSPDHLQKPMSPPGRRRVAMDVMALGEARGGLVPGPRPAVGAAFDIEAFDKGFVSPSARLAVFFSEGQVTVSRGSAELWLLGARFEGCPIRVGGTAVALRPCVGGELGSVLAYGNIPPNSGSGTALWASVELSLRLRVGLTDRAFLELSGGPVFPLNRPSYYFLQPKTSLYDVPAVSYRAAIGPGFSF